MGDNLTPVLVVTVPDLKPESVERVRREILAQLRERVLVVPDGITWRVERLPVGPEVAVLPEESAEKRRILARLQDYRKDKGLGCFGALAAKCKRWKVTPELLRAVVFDGAPITLEQLRAVDRALDRLESEEGGKDGGA